MISLFSFLVPRLNVICDNDIDQPIDNHLGFFLFCQTSKIYFKDLRKLTYKLQYIGQNAIIFNCLSTHKHQNCCLHSIIFIETAVAQLIKNGLFSPKQ